MKKVSRMVIALVIMLGAYACAPLNNQNIDPEHGKKEFKENTQKPSSDTVGQQATENAERTAPPEGGSEDDSPID